MKRKAIFGIGAITLVAVTFLIVSMTSGITKENEPAPWQKRCSNDESGNPVYCEISQQLFVAETNQRLVDFSVGFPPDSQNARGVIILPLGIILDKDMTVEIDDSAKFAFRARFCQADGCYSFINLTPDVLDIMRKGEIASVSFQDRTGQNFQLQMSLEGFSKTLDSLS